MKRKIKVHVADDHKILIEGIIAVINTDEDIEIVGYSLTGKEVVEWFITNTSDILILDISMPELDGFQVLEAFKARNIEQKVIVLSSYEDAAIVKEVLDLGADGFLAKNAAGEHIIKAIKAVHDGQQYFSDDIQKKLLQFYTGQTASSMSDRAIIQTLTDREMEVLKLVAKEYSTIEMADLLNLSINTVETYRKSLLKKINVKNAVGLAMFAVRNKII